MAVAELASVLFASLRRADQRTRGVEYLRGLLTTPGRKSIRNIAAAVGGTEQRLHHFVSDSTWDWVPVRRALTQYVMARVEPRAWVLRPMVIPKAGNQSVGVGRRFDPVLGHTLNAQQAVGVWAASERVSAPVGWRLQLSSSWLTEANRRRAAIPSDALPESIGDCMVAAYDESGVPEKPVVLDARDLGPVLSRLRGTGFVARISPTLPVTPVGPALPGHDAVHAYWILAAAKDRRRPVTWHDGGVPHTVLVATVEVLTHEVGAVTLFGVSPIGAEWPEELWLTNLTAPPIVLLQLTRLPSRVDRDFAAIADRVGLRDFSGRSFVGWHRHVTLASAAHVVAALTEPSRTRLIS